MKKTIIDILTGVMIGFLIMALLFFYSHPRPGPANNPTHVTENPSSTQQQNKPVIQEQHSVTSTSHISISPAPIPGAPPEPKPVSTFLSLSIGEKYSAPAEIVFNTKYLDRRKSDRRRTADSHRGNGCYC
jgi:hypothetical protein